MYRDFFFSKFTLVKKFKLISIQGHLLIHPDWSPRIYQNELTDDGQFYFEYKVVIAALISCKHRVTYEACN